MGGAHTEAAVAQLASASRDGAEVDVRRLDTCAFLSASSGHGYNPKPCAALSLKSSASRM